MGQALGLAFLGLAFLGLAALRLGPLEHLSYKGGNRRAL